MIQVLVNFLMAVLLFILAACDDVSKQTQNDKLVIEEGGLVFDPIELNMGTVLEGEKATATILIRNDGHNFSQIVKVESSCGCTTAEPEMRMLAGGAFTALHIEVDTFGKRGDIRKSITMTDQHGKKRTAWLSLHIKSNPHAMNESRSIFDGKCASCHVEPAKGKTVGSEIYAAVCVMCHGVGAKGAYAPSLLKFKDAGVLGAIISHGTGTHHMPAFAKEKGGPLSAMQISALSKWIISLDE